ncbi:winged helix-turn-helix domain-containing protein [Thalassotalea fusca]
MMQYDLGQGTFFCAKNGIVIKIDGDYRREFKLDNLESSLLQLFINNVGITLSKNDLMKVWRSQYVMEHSVTRVISTLRKKLGDTHRKAAFIKTIPRAGYQFIGQAHAIELDLSPNHIEFVKKTARLAKNWSKQIIAVQAIAICVLLFYVLQFSFVADTQQTDSPYKPIIEIIDNKTLKTAPASTADGEWIAYSAKSNSSNWFLKFINTQTGNAWQFSQQDLNLSNPAWLNKHSVVFRQWNKNVCEIRKITFDELHNILNNESITYCHPSTFSKGLAALNDKEILVTDSDALTSPLQLYKVTIETGAKETIQLSNDVGHGIYRVYVSPNKQFIATLTSLNWFATIVKVHATGNFEEPIWQKTIDYPLFSLALDDSLVTFKNAHGGLSTVNFLGKSNIESFVPLLLTRAIYSPVYSPGGFLFTEGEMYAKNISLHNLETGISEVILDSTNTSLNAPILLDSSTLLFTSNQTGINQIWRYELKEQKRIQISSFDEPYFVYRVELNDNRDLIAISTNKGIILAQFINGYIGNTIAKFKGKNPVFWQNKLIYNRYLDDRNTIYTFLPETSDSKLLINNGAYKAVVDQGKLYYSKFHKKGIWQYVEGGEDQLIYSKYSPSPPEMWDIHQGALYIGEQEENTIIRVDLQSNYETTFSMGDCKTANIVFENHCIATHITPSVNRLLKFTYDL